MSVLMNAVQYFAAGAYSVANYVSGNPMISSAIVGCATAALYAAAQVFQTYAKNRSRRKDLVAEKEIKEFVSDLRTSKPGVVFTPPELGSSGFTFLCAYPKNNRELYQFVLKWIPKQQAFNEKVCSELAHRYTLLSPNVQIVSKEFEEILRPYAKASAKAMDSVDGHTLISMVRFKTDTLGSAILKRSFQNLSEKAIHKFYTSIGEAVIFDLCIANNDRVVRFDPNIDGGYRGDGSVNVGNIMVNIKDKELREIYYIDNGSVLVLKPTSEKRPVENIGCLFGEEPEAEESSFSKEQKRSKEKGAGVDAWHHLFCHFVTDPKLLAGIACAKISKEVDLLDTDARRNCVLKGIRAGIDRIRKLDLTSDEENEAIIPLSELICKNQRYLRRK